MTDPLVPPRIARLATDAVDRPASPLTPLASAELAAGIVLEGQSTTSLAFQRPSLVRQGTMSDAHGSTRNPGPLPLANTSTAATSLHPERDISGRLTAEQMHSMTRVNAGVPSPSGTYVAFSAKYLSSGPDSVFSEENSAFTTSIFLLETCTLVDPPPPSERAVYQSSPKRLTFVKNIVDTSPLWLDNETIAFLSNRSGKMQVWALSIHGGEPEQLTDYPISVGNLQFNAACSYLVFSAGVDPSAGDSATDSMSATAAREEATSKRKAQYHSYTKLYARHWDHWRDQKRSHLFLQPLLKRAPLVSACSFSCGVVWTLHPAYAAQDLMFRLNADCPVPPFGGEEDFAISPDGREIAYCSQLLSDSSAAWSTNHDIYVIKLSSNASADGECALFFSGVFRTNFLASSFFFSPSFSSHYFFMTFSSSSLSCLFFLPTLSHALILPTPRPVQTTSSFIPSQRLPT